MFRGVRCPRPPLPGTDTADANRFEFWRKIKSRAVGNFCAGCGRQLKRPLQRAAIRVCYSNRYGFGVVGAGFAGATEPAGLVPGVPVGRVVGVVVAAPAGFGGAGTPDSVL